MVAVSNVFSLSYDLSTSLQSGTIDLVYFLNDTDELKSKVKNMRKRSEDVFHPLPVEEIERRQDYEFRMRMPRWTPK